MTGPIAVIVAMEPELRHLADRLDPVAETRHGPWTVRAMRRGETDLRLLCCGIGMINAAAGAEFLCDHLRPSAMLNFGCTGAHTRDLFPGDVVIGEATVHHGAFHVLETGETYFPEADYTVTGETVVSNTRPCDPALVDRATAAARGWTPDPWPEALGWPAHVPHRAGRVATGVVASADIWNQQPDRIDLLHARHRSLCEDMEAAAINRICGRWEVPFLTVKDISNNEFHVVSDLQGDIEVLPAAEIGRRSAALLLRMLDRPPG
ncbi:MAG: 5'-methylthioadenosine/S-adenosylhomocysteine nucleosidase [Chloroflexota bacterium]